VGGCADPHSSARPCLRHQSPRRKRPEYPKPTYCRSRWEVLILLGRRHRRIGPHSAIVAARVVPERGGRATARVWSERPA
jgi:hypothetical protein